MLLEFSWFVSADIITEEIVFPMRRHAHEEHCGTDFAIYQVLWDADSLTTCSTFQANDTAKN